jgi:hypothetical protein
MNTPNARYIALNGMSRTRRTSSASVVEIARYASPIAALERA